jgi:hypothetical protein
MRQRLFVASTLILFQVGLAPARAAESSFSTVGLCPNINFSGFSVGSENAHVVEKIWWDAEQKSYFIQGPELAQRFLYPDEQHPVSQLKSDLTYVYKIPVDQKLTRVDENICRPKVEISSECQIAPVASSLSQPALIFTAQYYDECERTPTQIVIRIEKLTVGSRTGIQFSFYNAFRKIYDAGMDVFDGNNVFNMGYRLK